MFVGFFTHVAALGPVGPVLVLSMLALTYWVSVFGCGFVFGASLDRLRHLHESGIGRALQWWATVGLLHVGVLGSVIAFYFPGFHMSQENLDKTVELFGGGIPPAMGSTACGLVGLLLFNLAYIGIERHLETDDAQD